MGKRIEWIDLAKGMAIILVVYGHSGLASLPYAGPWVLGFHMPFFFVISGMLFDADRFPTFRAFISKRWKTLIRPYFIFSAICWGAYCYLYPGEIREQTLTILCKGWGGLALWFIPVLALTEIAYYFIRKYIRSTTVTTLMLLISALLGWVAYKQELPYYYNIWFVFTALLFYGAGNLLKPYILKIAEHTSSLGLTGISAAALLLSGCFILNPRTPEFFINYLGTVYTYPAAVGGTLFMCCAAIMLSRMHQRVIAAGKQVFVFLGQNTYVILAFHQVILMVFVKLQLTSSGSVQRLAMWGLLTVLILAINKYLPFVLGRPTAKSNSIILGK